MIKHDPERQSVDMDELVVRLHEAICSVSVAYEECSSDDPERTPEEDLEYIGNELCSLLEKVGCDGIPIVSWSA